LILFISFGIAKDYITKDYIDPLTIYKGDNRYCKLSDGCAGTGNNVTYWNHTTNAENATLKFMPTSTG